MPSAICKFSVKTYEWLSGRNPVLRSEPLKLYCSILNIAISSLPRADHTTTLVIVNLLILSINYAVW